MPAPPLTVIVVHPREKRRKCTVEPLRGRDGFLFRKFPAPLPDDVTPSRFVRLGIGGPVLGPDDADRGLLILDGTWKLAEAMEAAYPDFPLRSLPPCLTAYPRTSKVRDDPAPGLATIEAVYLAHCLLGRPTAGLLDHYHWAAEFLQRNGLPG